MNNYPFLLLSLYISLTLGCDDSPDLMSDAPQAAGIQSPIAFTDQPKTVAQPDPWVARLDHSEIGPIEGGFAITAYDANANSIGQISVIEVRPNMVEITHEYPRPCADSVLEPGACSDTLSLTVHLAQRWEDGWSNAPAALFSDRATAIVAKLPPDTEEGRLACALTIAAASASCVAIGVSGPLAAPGCALGALASLCKCETFHKAFPDVDWDELCN